MSDNQTTTVQVSKETRESLVFIKLITDVDSLDEVIKQALASYFAENSETASLVGILSNSRRIMNR